jgi:hypothetical protein
LGGSPNERVGQDLSRRSYSVAVITTGATGYTPLTSTSRLANLNV